MPHLVQICSKNFDIIILLQDPKLTGTKEQNTNILAQIQYNQQQNSNLYCPLGRIIGLDTVNVVVPLVPCTWYSSSHLLFLVICCTYGKEQMNKIRDDREGVS